MPVRHRSFPERAGCVRPVPGAGGASGTRSHVPRIVAREADVPGPGAGSALGLPAAPASPVIAGGRPSYLIAVLDAGGR
jgi:hypothetical protein